jgi:hypothetical protein
MWLAVTRDLVGTVVGRVDQIRLEVRERCPEVIGDLEVDAEVGHRQTSRY